MNNEKKNIFSENLNNLDDTDIEKISKDVPALDKKAKKRILKKCMSRMSETDFEPEITVSGTEKYSKPRFRNFALSTAACLCAAIGITGIIFINRNIGTPPDDMPSTSQYTAIPVQSGTVIQTSTAVENTLEIETKTTAALNTEKVTAEVSTALITEVHTVNKVTEQTKQNPITEPVTENITELPTEVSTSEAITETSTTEPASDITDHDSFSGKYTTHKDSDSGNEIEIVKTDENIYHIELKFYRIAYFSDGIGTVNNDILTFTTGSIEGSPAITGEITLNENGCMLKIIESEHQYVQADNGEGMQYYKITE